jgi:hypothetical protein
MAGTFFEEEQVDGRALRVPLFHTSFIAKDIQIACGLLEYLYPFLSCQAAAYEFIDIIHGS